MEEKKELSKVCKLAFQGQTFEVKFPTVGQTIDIETMKITLSNGIYRQMVSTNSGSGNLALDFIDAIAVFTVLIPELKTHLKIDNIMNLTPFEMKEMVLAYKKVFFPWYSEWFSILQKDLELLPIPKEEKE